METTITTLRWGMLHMIHNPDIQAKIQAEIDEHITGDREIQMSDKNVLHYTMAAVNVSFNILFHYLQGTKLERLPWRLQDVQS